MRLTVLGKSPSWQDADGACSGYLLEDGDTCVLIDCGNGVFSKLRRFAAKKKVSTSDTIHHTSHMVMPIGAATTTPARKYVRSRPTTFMG